MKFQRMVLDSDRGFGCDIKDQEKSYPPDQITLGQLGIAKAFIENDIAVHQLPLIEHVGRGHKRAPIDVVVYSTLKVIEYMKLIPAFQRMADETPFHTDREDVVGWMRIETVWSSVEEQLQSFQPIFIVRDKPFIIKKMDRFFNPIIERYEVGMRT